MSNNNNMQGSGFRTPVASPCSDHAGGAKTWCSERVPLSSHRSRHRHVAASALLPFSSGRAMPSKWEDAERWISSPGSVGGGLARTSHLVHHRSYYCQRRSKSNSGPLGHDGLFSYGGFDNYSPVLGMGVIHGGQWRNVGQARFEDGLVGNFDQGGRKSCPGEPDWLELWSRPLIPSPQGEIDLDNEMNNKEDERYKDEVGGDGMISRDISTQMFDGGEKSGNCSSVSTPKSMISTIYTQHPQLEDEACEDVNQSSESQVKDVQVDEHIICTTPKSHLHNSNSPYHHATQISKQQREEFRIKAWENLQKAKAQAAIQKLEMKLEKKRSLSMDKIMEKLKKAEIKAEKMRSSVVSKGDDGRIQRHKTTTFSKLPLFCRKVQLRSSITSCSTCYPF